MLGQLEKQKRYIPLSYDLMFKKVFADERDKRPLKYLLKVILGIEAKNIRILNNEILGDNIDSKKTTVDLIVEVESGMKIGIEMNRTVSKEIIERNLVFMFRIMGNDLKHSESYKNLDKHIQINFDMTGNHNKPIETFKITSVEDPEIILTDKLEIIRINVPYFTKKCYNLSNEELTKKEKLIGLIGIEEEEKALEVVDEDDIMGEIVKKVRGFSKEDAILMSYDRDFHVKECARIEAEQYIEEKMVGINEILEKIEVQKEEIESQKEQLKSQKEQLKSKKEELENQKEQIESQKEQLEIKKEQLKQQGFMCGVDTRNIEIAKSMIEKNMDIKLISEITGLQENELKNI